MARSSVIRVSLPQNETYAITPTPTNMDSTHATYALSESTVLLITSSILCANGSNAVETPLDVAMRWPDESKFQYREYESSTRNQDLTAALQRPLSNHRHTYLYIAR